MRSVPQLGRRGGGWVVLQQVLLLTIVILAVTGPRWPEGVRWWLRAVGVVVALSGVILFAAAVRALGGGMTQFPRPADRGRLVAEGPYAVIRHPIYAGAGLLLVGVSLAVSPWALAGTGVLTVVWGLKARLEERLLLVRYPGYAAYCARTRFRLVPYVY